MKKIKKLNKHQIADKKRILLDIIDPNVSQGKRSVLINSIILLNNHSSAFQLQVVFIATRLLLNKIDSKSIYTSVNALCKSKTISIEQIEKQLKELRGLKLLTQPDKNGFCQIRSEVNAYKDQKKFNKEFRTVTNFKDNSISLDAKFFDALFKGDDTNVKSFLCSIIVPLHTDDSIITYNKIKNDLNYSVKDIRNAKSLKQIVSMQEIPAEYVSNNVSNNKSVITDGKVYSTKIKINMKKENNNCNYNYMFSKNYQKGDTVERHARRKMAFSNILFGSDSYKKHLGKRSESCNINSVSKKGKSKSMNSFTYFQNKLK